MIWDLSFTIDDGCMTCGKPWHEKVKIEKMGTIKEVGRNTSRFILGSHTATHMDAPLHFFDGTHGIDENSLDICVGPVTCVDFSGKGAGSVVEIDDLHEINVTERMLFCFGWYKYWKEKQYYNSFPHFSTEAIKYLINKGMKLIALDTPSPDTADAIGKINNSPNHIILLENDIIIVEYLTNTDCIDYSKSYEIIALPLKIYGVDGAPARVILREVNK